MMSFPTLMILLTTTSVLSAPVMSHPGKPHHSSEIGLLRPDFPIEYSPNFPFYDPVDQYGMSRLLKSCQKNKDTLRQALSHNASPVLSGWPNEKKNALVAWGRLVKLLMERLKRGLERIVSLQEYFKLGSSPGDSYKLFIQDCDTKASHYEKLRELLEYLIHSLTRVLPVLPLFAKNLKILISLDLLGRSSGFTTFPDNYSTKLHALLGVPSKATEIQSLLKIGKPELYIEYYVPSHQQPAIYFVQVYHLLRSLRSILRTDFYCKHKHGIPTSELNELKVDIRSVDILKLTTPTHLESLDYSERMRSMKHGLKALAHSLRYPSQQSCPQGDILKISEWFGSIVTPLSMAVLGIEESLKEPIILLETAHAQVEKVTGMKI